MSRYDPEKLKQWADYLEEVIRDCAQARADMLNAAQERSGIGLSQEIADKINASTARFDRMSAEAARRAAEGDADLYVMLFSELTSPYFEVKKYVHSQKSGTGGKRSKRRPWAERVAARVTQWEDIPGPEDLPFEFEDLLVRVYRDGDTLIAADIDDIDAPPKELAQSSFERRYLKKENRRQ